MEEILLGRIKGQGIHTIPSYSMQNPNAYITGDLYIVADGQNEPDFKQGGLYLCEDPDGRGEQKRFVLKCSLRGQSFHAVRGSDFNSMYVSGGLTVGDTYLITSSAYAYAKGDVYYCGEDNAEEWLCNIIPQKGEDYFTEEDIAEIVRRVLAEFPSSEGVKY